MGRRLRRERGVRARAIALHCEEAALVETYAEPYLFEAAAILERRLPKRKPY